MDIEEVGDDLKLLGQWLRTSEFTWNRVEINKFIVIVIYPIIGYFYGNFIIEKGSKWIYMDLD